MANWHPDEIERFFRKLMGEAKAALVGRMTSGTTRR
jgi:hypothetical protein